MGPKFELDGEKDENQSLVKLLNFFVPNGTFRPK
jgi:hypothetical protein